MEINYGRIVHRDFTLQLIRKKNRSIGPHSIKLDLNQYLINQMSLYLPKYLCLLCQCPHTYA